MPFLPISGWHGDNLIEKSTNMGWWKGQKVKTMSGKEVEVNTLLDYLNSVCTFPPTGHMLIWYKQICLQIHH